MNFNEELKRDTTKDMLHMVGISIVLIVLIGVLVISFLC